MTTVFADAGYWVALWYPRDALHERAVTIANILTADKVVTTQMVLTEALDGMAGFGEFRRRNAAQMVTDLENDPDVEIVPQSDTLFHAALQRYTSRGDQTWSLTDCASFLVMEQRQITQALAYDRDFQQAGFTVLLR